MIRREWERMSQIKEIHLRPAKLPVDDGDDASKDDDPSGIA